MVISNSKVLYGIAAFTCEAVVYSIFWFHFDFSAKYLRMEPLTIRASTLALLLLFIGTSFARKSFKVDSEAMSTSQWLKGVLGVVSIYVFIMVGVNAVSQQGTITEASAIFHALIAALLFWPVLLLLPSIFRERKNLTSPTAFFYSGLFWSLCIIFWSIEMRLHG